TFMNCAPCGLLVSELSVPVPWGEIRGKIWGPHHGHPVLCLHGWADNCGSFNTLIPLLPKGNGRTQAFQKSKAYSLGCFKLQLFLCVRMECMGEYSIVHHKSGGHVAGMFSALYPEMVDALIFLDCFWVLPTDSQTETPTMIRQGIEELVQYEKKAKEKRVYTYEKAVERLLAANSSLSTASVHILLERGLVQVENGFVFSRDLRVNFKNIVRLSLEQSLEMLSRIQASVLAVLAQDGCYKSLSEPSQNNFTSTLLQFLRDRNHTVVTVAGDHHTHLNTPEVVASLISEFLQKKKVPLST
uniref:Serine hydrolase like n=1 Tax=Tetraodon nigroviridis TaxID=99883 RepID=H3CIY7_TETNG